MEHLGRKFDSFLQNSMLLSYNPAVMLPGIQPKEVKTRFTQKLAREYLQQLYSQLLKLGSNQGALQ